VTTGPNPYRDRIVDIGAVWVPESGEPQAYSSYVGGGHALTPADCVRLGIDYDGICLAPSAPEVLDDLLRAVPEECAWVSHGAALKQAFLRRASDGAFRERLIDTLKLSGIVLPSLMSYGVADLCGHFGVPLPEDGRAASSAARVLPIWQALLDVVTSLPEPLLAQVAGLLSPLRSEPLGRVFRACCTSSRRRAVDDYLGLFHEQAVPRRRKAAEAESFVELDEKEVAGVFGAEGGFAETLASYEPREEQVAMSEAIVEALNDSRHLRVEAGTGVGKSLAYAVPCALWSLINETPVVLSTNTKNLQRQLYDHDLPLVRRALGADFKAALIKGRRNYLCLRRALYLIRHANTELERDERLPFASVLCWARETETGDLSESLVGDRPNLRGLTGKLVSVAEECAGGECPLRKRCFLQRARGRALSADLVVANHAVVLSEIGMPRSSPVLPPYLHIVFDEAHNLEDAATSAFSKEISLSRIRGVLNRLWRSGPRRRERGLVPSLLAALDSAGIPAERASVSAAVVRQGRVVCAAVADAGDLLAPFFHFLVTFIGDSPDVQARRLHPEHTVTASWEGVLRERAAIARQLGAVIQEVELLLQTFSDFGDDDMEGLDEFSRDLAAVAQWIREFVDDSETVIETTDPSLVYWVERVPAVQGGARAWGAPVSVAGLLSESLYSQKQSVVFTSATLAVNGSPDFVKGRLGLDLIEPDRLGELILGTPFDFSRQCRVFVPTFLPEPGEPDRDYVAELSALLGDVFRTTHGRGMTLFTSYKMLRRAYALLRREVRDTGMRVLAQSISGSRDRITHLFRGGVPAVLLGTHSFWEGVDVVGDALSCLVLARLPFPVHTDPIVAARCEQLERAGRSGFSGYSVPQAVIRFRQGFGRLIRHRNDMGIVIVADRRIVTRRYGDAFRDSLPVDVTVCGDAGQLLERVRAFFRSVSCDDDGGS
jgi:predicted DnaQ family exonuclease/DinG family helicase